MGVPSERTRNDMTEESNEQDQRKTLSLGTKGKMSLSRPGDAAHVRQSFSHGRSKTVQVEVKRKRHIDRPGGAEADAAGLARPDADGRAGGRSGRGAGPTLTQAEREARQRALRSAREDEARRPHPIAAEAVLEAATIEDAATADIEPPEALDAETLRAREVAELRRIEEDERRRAEEEQGRLEELERQRKDEESRRGAAEKQQEDEKKRLEVAERAGRAAAAKYSASGLPAQEEEAPARARRGREARRAPARTARSEPRRRGAKLSVVRALDDDADSRTRSLASVRRARERARHGEVSAPQEKIIRDVVVPETITVQELANRMAERGSDVIKTLMRMGVMATITQAIDGDTAELVVAEFGHRVNRVSEADVELGLRGTDDRPEDLLPRPPVVTVMGHVDHGKTSVLDALRKTDVVSHEAGGITQHIGAYQVTVGGGSRVTFIDTPGHEAFTEMRARGANTTDIVVLVVAADDGVMPQTIEAIRHAQAAKVPIIIAINKCDLPDADPDRVRTELLQYDIVPETMGGDVQTVAISAKTGEGLDTLLEAIQLQAEVLELKANPHHVAEGTVVEAKLERGRGAVATVLVQRGTLRVGDIFVTGSEWGRVRAMLDDRGEQLDEAGPARPVEILGLQGTPLAGDDFVVVDSEARARQIADYRARKKREAVQVANRRGTLEQMFDKIQAGEAKELPIVIKGDVQGSIEAIGTSLERLTADNTEVKVRVLHSSVGAINESDVTLANASKAMIIGFNVRANPQARELAGRDGVEIRYYNVIYNVIDDVRAALSGLLSPTYRETFLGNVEIREVFNISKVGKVAGCYVTEGVVRRGAGVRLLRDNVVIHEGSLRTLKRFKDEVREVQHGYECGMAFENYDDFRVGDVIEAYEIEEVARRF